MENNNNVPLQLKKQTSVGNKNQTEVPKRQKLDMKKIVQNYQFHLDNIVARNQTSQVFSGIQKDLQKKVAVKAISIQKIVSAKQRAQIQNQIKLCRSLPKHRNIVTVLDVFSTSNNYYLMMELCPMDLKKLLMERKVLTQDEVVTIILDVLQGIKHLSLNGYIHCNIRPSNILIGNDGLKITDFALTRRIRQDNSHKNTYQPNQWNPYMSPLTLVTKSYDQNNDVWALAVLTYECLHGYHNYPWKFEFYTDLLQKIYQQNIQYSRKLSKQITQFLNRSLNPQKKLSVLDLYDDPYIKRQLQKKKGIQILSQSDLHPFNKLQKLSPQKYFPDPYKKNELQMLNKINFDKNKAQMPLNEQKVKRTLSNFQDSSPNKIKLNNQNKKILIKQILDCHVAFMRFVNIILRQDEVGHMKQIKYDPKYAQVQQKKYLDHKIFRFVLIKQVLTQKHCLKQTFNSYSPVNPFKIQDIEQYLANNQNGQSISDFKKLLKEYDSKYQSLQQQMQDLVIFLGQKLSKMKCQWRPKDILSDRLQRKQIIPILGVRLSRELCKYIWREIQISLNVLKEAKANQAYYNQLLEEIEEKSRRLDFLMTYYLLNCLLIDHFQSSEYFARNSKLNIIMSNKPSRMELEHLGLMEEKLKKLEII